ncbi:MAG: AgmX/PglI C-terminal domain-containing protein [Pseudomonadota bacterium]|nr:AgmX/PglI C-terminal domain-containing protein [Pseudomonadota bacterium]
MRFSILLILFLSTSSFAATEREDVRSVVKEHLKDVKICYSEALAKKPEIEGKVVVDWTVSDTGAVTKVSINDAKTTLKDLEVQSCITEKFKSWKFPPAQKDQVITVSYPFVFTRD